MKRFLSAAVVASLIAVIPPVFAGDIGVSVSIGQPGFYGRIDIGDYPPPQLIYRQPMMIERVPMGRPPIYLRVPPGHAKHWDKHCWEYNACGERVLFVQDSWYSREYVPRYQAYQRDRWEGRREEYRDDHRGNQRDERRSERGNGRHGGDDDKERGHGHGRGGRD